jgi:hypothetical protein
MRKGISDLHRRAQVSEAANERYAEALASVEETIPLGKLVEELCKPARWKDKRVRALNPYSPQDSSLLQAINRGEFKINGFRNRDLQHLLWPNHSKATPSEHESLVWQGFSGYICLQRRGIG